MKNLEQRISFELLNCRCDNFRFVEGGTLILHFEQKYAESKLRNRLWIDSAWRLQTSRLVQIGSIDDGEDVVSAMQQVVGQTLQSIAVSDYSGDLQLTFQNGITVASFGHSVSIEHWEFRRSDGLRIGIGPGFTPFERKEAADETGGDT